MNKHGYPLVAFLALFFAPGTLSGQQPVTAKLNHRQAIEWLRSERWKCGARLTAGKEINIDTFAMVYHRSQALWDKAFQWLGHTRLDTLSPGRYLISGTDLFATVSNNTLKNEEEAKWEAHRKYIDLHLVISGEEAMEMVPLGKAKSEGSYEEGKDLTAYSVKVPASLRILARPGTFYLFFPSDVHRTGIKTPKSGKDKKVVLKIKVTE